MSSRTPFRLAGVLLYDGRSAHCRHCPRGRRRQGIDGSPTCLLRRGCLPVRRPVIDVGWTHGYSRNRALRGIVPCVFRWVLRAAGWPETFRRHVHHGCPGYGRGVDHRAWRSTHEPLPELTEGSRSKVGTCKKKGATRISPLAPSKTLTPPQRRAAAYCRPSHEKLAGPRIRHGLRPRCGGPGLRRSAAACRNRHAYEWTDRPEPPHRGTRIAPEW
jgi:hypothetical protein